MPVQLTEPFGLQGDELELDQAEAIKTQLQEAIGPQHAAAKLLDTFGDTVSKTLDAQREWLKLFTGSDPDDT